MTEFIILSKDELMTLCADMPVICYLRRKGKYVLCSEKYYAEQKESRSEIPNTCGDAISRDAAIRAIEALQRPIMREESNYYQFKFSGMSEALGAVENLPSVTPQQRTGRWIAQDVHNCHTSFKCSECDQTYSFMHPYGEPTADYSYCPHCGAKMEVEE